MSGSVLRTLPASPASGCFPVTGWSAVNCLGTTTAEVVSALRGGAPALGKPPLGTPFDAVCGVVDPELPSLPDILGDLDSRNNRFVQRALQEIEEPLARATL